MEELHDLVDEDNNPLGVTKKKSQVHRDGDWHRAVHVWVVNEPKLMAAQDILRVPGRHVVRLTYVGDIDGEPTIDEESTEYKWFTAAEIKVLSYDELDIYFKDLVKEEIIKL